MKTLQIIIDGAVHDYVKIPISEYSCTDCSLNVFCMKKYVHKHICNLFDTEGLCRPTGVYGHFKQLKTE